MKKAPLPWRVEAGDHRAALTAVFDADGRVVASFCRRGDALLAVRMVNGARPVRRAAREIVEEHADFASWSAHPGNVKKAVRTLAGAVSARTDFWAPLDRAIFNELNRARAKAGRAPFKWPWGP